MTPTICSVQQLLKWEQEAHQTKNQQPIPWLMKALKTDLKADRWLGINDIRIKGVHERLQSIGKKYFQCDLQGVLKEQIVNHQVANIPLDGMKPEDFNKEMTDYQNSQTDCIFE